MLFAVHVKAYMTDILTSMPTLIFRQDKMIRVGRSLLTANLGGVTAFVFLIADEQSIAFAVEEVF